MFINNFDPVAIEIFSLEIRWYSLAYIFGIILGWILAKKLFIQNIEIKNKTAIIKGPTKLTGAEVMATDLRASVSLVLAGLVAENKTTINRIYHLDRGYEFLESKLKRCKAEIKRI